MDQTPQDAARYTTRPLPIGPSLDLRSRDALTVWNQDPFTETLPSKLLRRIAGTMPALTAPQMVAVLLGRAPESISLTATRGCSNRLGRQPETWRTYRLTRYNGVWDRSHRTIRFRLQPDRVRRHARLSAANPLTAVLEWATPDDVLEHRFLMAGLPATMGWADKQRLIRAHLTNWEKLGLVTDVVEHRVPADVWGVTERGAREYGVHRHAVRPAHVNHQALAVEAAVMLGAADPAVAHPMSIVGDEELQARSRRGIPFGTAFAASRDATPTPDVEVQLRDGGRLWIEVLSESYRDKRIVMKRDEVPAPTRFVTPSAQLARRASALLGKAIDHF